MAYYECEAVQSHSGTRLRGLASDGGEHVEARDLGLAAAGLPAADPPLVTRKIPKEGSRSAESQGNDPEPQGDVDCPQGGNVFGAGGQHSCNRQDQPARDTRRHETDIGPGRFLHQARLLANRLGILSRVDFEAGSHGRGSQDPREFRAALLERGRQGTERIDAGLRAC